MSGIDLYYAPTPNGWKISIMLEELKAAGAIPGYDVIPMRLDGDQFTAEFLLLSPNNRMPVLVDHAPKDGGQPFSVFESGAILGYLADKYHAFCPSSGRGKARVAQWLFWQVGGLGPMAGQLSHFLNYAPQLAPDKDHSYALDRYVREYDRLFSVMERQLNQTRFLAGEEYTIADMACFPWCVPYRRYMDCGGPDIAKYPKLRAWFEELKQRPSVQAGINLGKDKRTFGKKLDQDRDRRLYFQDGSTQQVGNDQRSRL